MMFSIIEHIEYLLTRHDCVVIPDWGAFIANYDAARYDSGHSVMERPCRIISFNNGLTHNDGLLAHSLMRREGMDYKQAMRLIADSVASFRKQLAEKREVSMGHLGYFRSNRDRLVEFVSLYPVNSNDQYYGLASVNIDTVDALERETATVETLSPAVPAHRGLLSRKATQIAASIVALIGMSIMLTTPIIVDRSQQASMALEVKAPQQQQVEQTVSQHEEEVAQTVQVIEDKSAIARVGNESGHYYMVIATLRNQHELNGFKKKYSALVPYMKILSYKGMMCVYVARSDDYNTLMNLRGELPERLRDVWIYS